MTLIKLKISEKRQQYTMYRVGLVVWHLGLVDLDLWSSPGWWAGTVASYCPSRMVEHSISKSTQPMQLPNHQPHPVCVRNV